MRLPGSIWTPTGERLLRPVAGGAEWPTRGGGGNFDTQGEVSASDSTGTNIIGGASANTKGAWAVLSASTPIDAHGLIFYITNPFSFAREYLVDIGVGAAGAEQPIAENLHASYDAPGGFDLGSWYVYYLPIAVPAGTRLAARCQTSVASGRCRAAVTLLGHQALPSPPLGRISTYGAVTADSGGTSIDPGGVANTKGAWSELTASTDHDIQEVILAFGNQAQTSHDINPGWLVDIGVGAAGSEVVKIGDIICLTGSGGALACRSTGLLGPIPCYIPAGTRIAARAQSTHTTATARLFDLIVYGIG